MVWKVHRRPVLHGRLTDDQGKGVKGWVYIDDDWVESNGDGAYAMLEPQGTEMGVAMDDEKKLGAGFVYAAGDGERLDLTLLPMGSIVGQMVDGHGQGARVGTVEVWVNLGGGTDAGVMENGSWVWKTDVESDGRFRIAPVPAGYSMTVKGVRDGEQFDAKKVEWMDGGEEMDVWKLRWRGGEARAAAERMIAGRIVGDGGKPLSGVMVGAQGGPADAITDLAGRFTLGPVAADRKVELGARCSGYGYSNWTVGPGETGGEFRMFRPGHMWFGKAAPDLIVEEWVQGKWEGWAGLRGKVVLLQVGDPNDDELRSAKGLLERYGAKGLVVVTVHRHVAAGAEAEVVERCRENGVTWAVGIDADVEKTPAWVTEKQGEGATASVYDSREYPTSMYLIDKKGVVRGSPTGREVAGEIEKLLGE
ncbi:MAG: hypothetical protein ACTHN5_14900 [Phycisphaerae bacterium]